MLYRAGILGMAVGLLTTLIVFTATLRLPPQARPRSRPDLLVVQHAPARDDLAVVDIRRDAFDRLAADPDRLLLTLGISLYDTLVAIGDQPVSRATSSADAVASDLRVAAATASFVDITLRRAGQPTRIVVLLH
jgi:hypothetical protein